MSQNRVLLVHPEASVRALLTSMLQTSGCQIEEASNDWEAVRKLEQAPVDLVLAACKPADPEALELLAYLRRKHPKVPCVLLFAAPHPDRERAALNRGAASVLRYPLPAHALRAAVAQALGPTGPAPSAAPRPAAAPRAAYALAAAPAGARAPAHALTAGPAAAAPPGFAEVVGQDPKLRQALELAAAIAPSHAPVLLVGESWAGEALLARTMHRPGARGDGPVVELECRGPSETALEVELFGQGLPDGRLRPGHAAAWPAAAGIVPLKEALEGPERRLILEALEALKWNRQETARVLDINRTTLYKKMKKYGLLLDEPTLAN